MALVQGGDDSLGGVQMEGEGEDADLLLGDYESDREEWQGRDKEFRWDSSSDSEAEGRRAEEEEDRNKELDLSFRKVNAWGKGYRRTYLSHAV